MKYIYFILLAWMIVRCGGSIMPATETGMRRVKYQEPSDSAVLFTELIRHIRLIPLETGDDGFLTGDERLIAANGEFYAADPERFNVYRFDGNGRFLNRIGSCGRGPREYLNIEDFQVTGDTVIVFSSFPSFTACLYRADGGFIGRFREDSLGMTAACKTGSRYLVYSDTGHDNFKRYSVLGDGGIENQYYSSAGRMMMMRGDGPVFSRYKETLFSRETYCDTIYRFKADYPEPEPYIALDFGELSLDDRNFKALKPNELISYLQTKKGYLVTSMYMENDHFRLIELSSTTLKGKGPIDTYIYGLNKKNEDRWSWLVLRNNREGILGGTFKYINGDTLYSLIKPTSFRRLSEWERAKISNPGVLDSLGAEDNFVIAEIVF